MRAIPISAYLKILAKFCQLFFLPFTGVTAALSSLVNSIMFVCNVYPSAHQGAVDGL